MDGEIENQVLGNTTRFDPLPDSKNFLVTGGNGFIGSWIIRTLTLTYPNYRLVSFDKLDYGASMNNTRELESMPNFTFVNGDITDHDQVASCLRKYEIDTIIHLAARTNVDASFKAPRAFAATNIYGTQIMLECAKECDVKRFVHMSSYEVYGATQAGPTGHREDEALAPMSPYGAGKAAAEMLVVALGHSTSVKTVIVRANNIYGPMQFPDKIVPKFSMLLTRDKPLPLHDGGWQRKRYLYAGDAANAFNYILHLAPPNSCYNLGPYDPESEISNSNISLKLISLVHPPTHAVDGTGPADQEVNGNGTNKWFQTVPGRPYVDAGQGMDCGKLRDLGWEQKVSLDEGLKRSVAWYVANGDVWWGDLTGKVW